MKNFFYIALAMFSVASPVITAQNQSESSLPNIGTPTPIPTSQQTPNPNNPTQIAPVPNLPRQISGMCYNTVGCSSGFSCVKAGGENIGFCTKSP